MSANETATLAVGASMLMVVYTIAVFMCGRMCCTDSPQAQGRPFLPPRRRMVYRHRPVEGTTLNQPFAGQDLSGSSEEVIANESDAHNSSGV